MHADRNDEGAYGPYALILGRLDAWPLRRPAPVLRDLPAERRARGWRALALVALYLVRIAAMRHDWRA